jgi:hypothetical protein
VLGVNKCTLIVFYTDAHGWQFRVVGADGAVFKEQKLYYTPEAAEMAGREWIVLWELIEMLPFAHN